MTSVGLSVFVKGDATSAEQAMDQFYASVLAMSKRVQAVFTEMGKGSNFSQMFRPMAESAKSATDAVINESKVRQQVNREETQAALNASRLRMQAQREETAAQRVATQAKRAEKDAYSLLVAETQEITRSYYNAAAAALKMGDSSEKTANDLQLMAAKALEANERLKSIEAGAGRFHRNVGNYSGATQYLQQSIAQLSGEIPNFFQSMRIGFMSIGNNIQPISMAIKGLRAENAKLLAQGEATKPILSTVIKSFLGWQTILLVGVGIVSRYGAELIDWATGADKAKAKAEALKKTQDELNQVQESATKGAGDQIAKLEVLNATMTDGSLSMGKRTAAYNEAKKLYPSYLGDLTKDQALNQGIARIIDEKLVPAILAAAQARAYEGKISVLASQNIELAEKKKLAIYEKNRKETDKLLAAEKARGKPEYTVTPNGSVIKTKVATDAQNTAKAYQEAADKVADFDAQIVNNQAHMQALANDARAAIEATGSLGTDGIDPLTHKTKESKEKIDALTKSSEKLSGKFTEIQGLLQYGLISSLDATQQKFDAVRSHIVDLIKNGDKTHLQEYIDLLQRLNYQISQMHPIDLNAAKGLKGISASDSFSKDFHEVTKGNEDRASAFGNDIFDKLPNLKKQRKNWDDTTEEMLKRTSQFTTRTGRLLSKTMDPFIDAIFEGKNAFDALGDSIKNVVADLIKAVAKAMILSAIGGKEYTAQQGGFGGILGGLLGIGLKAAIPFLAEGGVVSRPTLAMIGEAGTEAVVPLNKMSNLGGNQNLTLTTRWRGRDIEGSTNNFKNWKDY